MKAPDLAELRRLLAEARAHGPWSFDTTDHGDGVHGTINDDTDRDVADGVHRREGALIVAAVNALPYLLAKVEVAERLARSAELADTEGDVLRAVATYRKAGAE